MYCAWCGSKMSDNAKFCSECGKKHEPIAVDLDEKPDVPGDILEEESSVYEEIFTNDNYEENESSFDPINEIRSPEVAPSMFDKLKAKAKAAFIAFWNSLTTFGKVLTISITVCVLFGIVAFLVGKVLAGVLSVIQMVLFAVAWLMKRGKIQEKKKNLHIILIVVAFVLLIPHFAAYKIGNRSTTNSTTSAELDYSYQGPSATMGTTAHTEPPVIEWPQNQLAELIPVPASIYGEVEVSTDDQVQILVMELGQEDFNTYKKSCAEVGFTTVIQESDSEYEATNIEGYRLAVSYVDTEGLRITIRQPLRSVDITISCTPNLFFNKYNLSVYWNGEEKDTIAHGQQATYHFDLENGTYELEIRKDGYTRPAETIEIDVFEDAEITYKVSCDDDAITVTQEEYISMRPLSDNEIRMPNPVSAYRYENYESVVAELTNLGFTNIETVPVYDIYWGVTDEGDVDSVSIAGITDFSNGAIFEKDAEVIITYHMAEEDDPSRIKVTKNATEYEGLNYTYVEEELKGLGFTNIVYEDEITTNTCYHTGEVVEVRINYSEFETGDSFMPDAEVKITRYRVDSTEAKPSLTVTMNGDDFSGMHYTEAETKVREMGFKNIEYRERITHDPEVTPETIDFVEIDYIYSYKTGEMFDADAEVVLVYWKYEEFKSDYEMAFVRRVQNYSIYYMFDTDAKKVAYFYTDDTGVSYAFYWGDFASGITINWTNGQGKEKFTYSGNGSTATLVDANGNSWEYVETDLINAQERLDDLK